MQVQNVYIGQENSGLEQNKLCVVKLVHGINPHIRKTRNGKGGNVE
mgnify:CR=1 FL=1